jgi:hypothetical protein
MTAQIANYVDNLQTYQGTYDPEEQKQWSQEHSHQPQPTRANIEEQN